MIYWFSSDFHLGHKNVIKYDNRPFNSIEEHDTTIIQNYNDLVKDEDHFYYLGDFSLTSKSKMIEYIEGMRGKKFFIKGNHDNKDTVKMYEKYGTYLGTLAEVKIKDQRIVLCHYKMCTWNKSHRGNWHLYGHSHGSAEHNAINKSFDIGINLWDYKPLSF